ncbi:MAG: zinc ribbon domain-containing protein [Peptococcaceae bacterium]|jgi:uncharacterized membrane protein YvbJ|nr:zinc ribbon domain-containing protein [Peptococcaceae bacterium]MDR2737274.1 zinc ribbon domain-containing protein [Gracilibacteraceae bacterium]
MVCGKCGMQNRDDNQYCSYCNQPLTDIYSNNNRSAGQSSEMQPDYGQQGMPNNGQAGYGQPGYGQPFAETNTSEHVSMKKWVGIFILGMIPVVNLIYLILMFVWAFGNTPQKSLKTYAKANLLLMLITVVLSFIVGLILGLIGFSLTDFT